MLLRIYFAILILMFPAAWIAISAIDAHEVHRPFITCLLSIHDDCD